MKWPFERSYAHSINISELPKVIPKITFGFVSWFWNFIFYFNPIRNVSLFIFWWFRPLWCHLSSFKRGLFTIFKFQYRRVLGVCKFWWVFEKVAVRRKNYKNNIVVIVQDFCRSYKNKIPESFGQTNSNPWLEFQTDFFVVVKLLQATNIHHRFPFPMFRHRGWWSQLNKCERECCSTKCKAYVFINKEEGGKQFVLPRICSASVLENTFTCRNIIRTGTYAQ